MAEVGLHEEQSAAVLAMEPGAAGHGCGHNLLGAGAFGAVIGLAREMEARRLKGTVVFFGCPAEENFSGKAFMARDGLFNECDACLSWHPGALNMVRGSSSLAVSSMNITFHGRTSHASGDPYNGRSALDATLLMSMGVEFLREHMSSKARIHYVITKGGGQPNVVPAEAIRPTSAGAAQSGSSRAPPWPSGPPATPGSTSPKQGWGLATRAR